MDILKTIGIPKSRLIRPGELERAIELAARKTEGRGAVVVLLDSDDECPGKVGPDLLRRALIARSDVQVSVVLAKREFEAWFLAAIESLAGSRGLLAGLKAPPDPEGVRGAKEWLTEHMEFGCTYRETLDQPALAARLSLHAARRADSFDKFYRDMVRLCAAMAGPGT